MMLITVFVLLLLQRKDFPSNSFYVVVVVKTEDQACGGSLPFYPFVEGMFCALARDGPGRQTSRRGCWWIRWDVSLAPETL